MFDSVSANVVRSLGELYYLWYVLATLVNRQERWEDAANSINFSHSTSHVSQLNKWVLKRNCIQIQS